MNEIATINDGAVATAKTLEEAAAPQVEWDIQCVVSATSVVRVFASTPQEAMQKAAKVQGVIWPLGYRKTPPVIAAPAANAPAA